MLMREVTKLFGKRLSLLDLYLCALSHSHSYPPFIFILVRVRLESPFFLVNGKYIVTGFFYISSQVAFNKPVSLNASAAPDAVFEQASITHPSMSDF